MVSGKLTVTNKKLIETTKIAGKYTVSTGFYKTKPAGKYDFNYDAGKTKMIVSYRLTPEEKNDKKTMTKLVCTFLMTR